MSLLQGVKDFLQTLLKNQQDAWIEWNHVSISNKHCIFCMALDRCWFLRSNMPAHPQHFNCHCQLKHIETPIANVTANAKCNINKFSSYIFSDKYLWNGKRALFEELGFTIADCEYLQSEYEKQAARKYCSGEYKLKKLDQYGQRINITIKLAKNGRQIEFESGWLVHPKGLLTNTTPLGDN